MANQLGSNPWVIDTPGTGILFNGDVHACHFEWAGYTGQPDSVQVQDRFGKVIWLATGRADGSLVESYTLDWVHGINVTVLTSGSLRVFIE